LRYQNQASYGTVADEQCLLSVEIYYQRQSGRVSVKRETAIAVKFARNTAHAQSAHDPVSTVPTLFFVWLFTVAERLPIHGEPE
jgi:hypothetical protein